MAQMEVGNNHFGKHSEGLLFEKAECLFDLRFMEQSDNIDVPEYIVKLL